MSTTSSSAVHRLLDRGMYSRSGLVRKSCIFLLQTSKRLLHRGAAAADYRARPPVLSNSFPKSGTHLLDQIVAGLPNRVNYGGFLASLTSSFQMRPRSDESVFRYIRATTPGENVRAHLYFKPAYAAELAQLNFVHYFIFRDPRDVIVSSCHYLRSINPWHRWRKYFKRCATFEEALLLSIHGLRSSAGATLVPNVAERFAPFEGWLDRSDVCVVRFEDLRGDDQQAHLDRMLDFYADRSSAPFDRPAVVAQIRRCMVPEKSHTFRQGSGGGWREAFTPACREAFKQVAGDLLVRLGYEANHAW